MAEILKINETEVKIGTDEGKVITVPIATIAYPDPQEGDKVVVYQDGKSYIVKKAASSTSEFMGTTPDGGKSVNKHLFVWLGTFILGEFGVDRFLRGQIGLGIAKLLLGWLTLGIWPFVDWVVALVKAYGSAYGDTENLTFDAAGHYTR